MLDLHRRFGREGLQAPIQVGMELDALLGDLPQVRQAEDLEPTAVGQDGPVPMHEAMEPAGLFDQVGPGRSIRW